MATENSFRDEVSDLTISLDTATKSKVYAAALEISKLVINLGIVDAKSFRISDNPVLKEKVLEIIGRMRIDITESLMRAIAYNLLEISNNKNDILYDIDESEEYDPMAVLTAKFNNQTFADRLSVYSNRFMYEFEAYIAIGIAGAMTAEKIAESIMVNLAAPYKSKMFIDAFKNNIDFKSIRLAKGKPTYGVGKYVSSYNNISMLQADMINRAYYDMNRLAYRLNGYKHQQVLRTGYVPCEMCDETNGRVYPIEYDILPNHGRCICIAVPYKEEAL